MVLGIMDEIDYDEHQATLEPGDTLVLYTDGITEAMNTSSDLYGIARLEESIRAAAGSNAQDMIGAIIADVKAYIGDTPQADDLTLVTVKRTPW